MSKDAIKNDKQGNEKIGEVRIEEHPYVTKGFKYEVRMMLATELPDDLVSDDPDFDWCNYGPPEELEIWQVAKITQDKLFDEDRRLLQAMQKVDPADFKNRFEGRPTYSFFIRLEEDAKGYRVGKWRTTREEVVCDMLERWLEKEDQKVLVCTSRKVKFFPEEKPRVKAKIPITKSMFERILQKAAEKKAPNTDNK